MDDYKKIALSLTGASREESIGRGWFILRRSGISVVERVLAPGAREIRHYHRNSSQLFYLISGRGSLHIGGGVLELTDGEAAEVPPGENHQMVNSTNESLRFLVISTPSIEDDRVDVE